MTATKPPGTAGPAGAIAGLYLSSGLYMYIELIIFRQRLIVRAAGGSPRALCSGRISSAALPLCQLRHAKTSLHHAVYAAPGDGAALSAVRAACTPASGVSTEFFDRPTDRTTYIRRRDEREPRHNEPCTQI